MFDRGIDHSRLMIRDENRDDDQIAAFYANFYSNFEYMVQTLSQVT